MDRACRNVAQFLMMLFAVAMLVAACNKGLRAQHDANPPADSVNRLPKAAALQAGQPTERENSVANLDPLAAQLRLLSSPSFRTREMAIWQIQQEPARAVDLIARMLPESDLNSSATMIELLSGFASQPDAAMGAKAQKMLEETAASGVSSIARLASNSLQAIADRREAQAIEILKHFGVELGMLPLFVNGAKQNDGTQQMSIALIDSRFQGGPNDLMHLRFLQHVDTVYLKQIPISDELIRTICEIRNLRGVVLSRVSVTVSQLQLLAGMKNFDHFELSYVDIGDESVEAIEKLPVWGSIRLFGTQLSRPAADRLKGHFSGLSFYSGRGGFLGIGSLATNTIVTQVSPNSGAERAGIQVLDRLTQVQSQPIKTFEDLKRELANFQAGDKVAIQLIRRGETMTVEVELTEGP